MLLHQAIQGMLKFHFWIFSILSNLKNTKWKLLYRTPCNIDVETENVDPNIDVEIENVDPNIDVETENVDIDVDWKKIYCRKYRLMLTEWKFIAENIDQCWLNGNLLQQMLINIDWMEIYCSKYWSMLTARKISLLKTSKLGIIIPVKNKK